DFFMRLADIQLAFPSPLRAIAVLGVLGPSLRNIIIVIGVSSWVVYARVVRGEVLSIREREYVHAAVALGSRHWRGLAGPPPLARAGHPRAAEHLHAVAGGGHPRHGAGDRDRVRPLVPGPGRAA